MIITTHHPKSAQSFVYGQYSMLLICYIAPHHFTQNLPISVCGTWTPIYVIFTARRYAKRGICRHHVSVCVSVCHTPVLYQNG